MIINPFIDPTPGYPSVTFREPKDKIDLDKELPKIFNAQGWGAGTVFWVFFKNHEMTRVLSYGLFLVTQADETMETTEREGQPHSEAKHSYAFRQHGGWTDLEPTEASVGRLVKGERKWSPEKQAHDVIVGEKIVFTTTDKALAQAVADGEEPIPEVELEAA